MKRIIERTEDGSATLFVPELNEHYHSIKGARAESQHIIIDMGFKASTAFQPRILEIGFGTGLNALLTLETAGEEKRVVHYTGIELYPLSWEEVDVLNYSDNPLFKKLTANHPPNLRHSSQTTCSTSFISMPLLPKSNRKCGAKSFSGIYMPV